MNRNHLRGLLLTAVFMILALGSKFYRGPGVQLVQHYLGDLFIVSSLYFFISLFLRRPQPWHIAAIAFSLAGTVELVQLADLSSPTMPSMISFWIGTSFDRFDFMAYALGAALALATDIKYPRGKNESAGGR